MNYRKHLLSIIQLTSIACVVSAFIYFGTGQDAKNNKNIRTNGEYGSVKVIKKYKSRDKDGSNLQYYIEISQSFAKGTKKRLPVKIDQRTWNTTREGSTIKAWLLNGKCSLDNPYYQPEFLLEWQYIGRNSLISCITIIVGLSLVRKYFFKIQNA